MWSQFSGMEEESFCSEGYQGIKMGLKEKKKKEPFLRHGMLIVAQGSIHRKLELDFLCVNPNIGPGSPALETLCGTCALLTLPLVPLFYKGKLGITTQLGFF